MNVIRLHRRDRSTRATSAVPCPQWCTKPVGHDLTSDSRLHQRGIADLDFARPGCPSAQARVCLVQLEVLGVDVWGLGDGSDPVFVGCQLQGDDLLTGPAARHLAAALTEAADAWDRAQTGV